MSVYGKSKLKASKASKIPLRIIILSAPPGST
ncbi:MAG: hypothetical protein FVQ80_17415 [Planctomycetes bacterium]|nr:hypothetical protein [Planctomycetota bacterium]